jgi:hypothetical protein
MTHDKTCRLETLARAGYVHIQRCTDCGCVSVHVGPLTMRLEPTGLVLLAQATADAVERVEAQLDARRPTSTLRGTA